jgi:dienelactone hydrolase
VGVAGVLACALALGACSGSSTESTTAPFAPTATTASTVPASSTTTRPRPYGVGTRELTYVDRSRPTKKNNDYPGASTRTIRVVIDYPARGRAPATDGAPFATILFSHGHNGRPEHSAALFADLVRAGYVVVAPEFPLSHAGAPGGAAINDLDQQPRDDTFVLDQVLAARRQPWLRGLVDPARIGAAGHSLGGITTYGLVYNTCCVDRRIKAAVVMSGAAGGYPGTFFTGITTPLLAIHGDSDPTVPYGAGRDAYLDAQPPKFFLTITGGLHSTEERGGTTPGQRAVTKSIIAFFDRYVRGDERALARLRSAATNPGLTKLEAEP